MVETPQPPSRDEREFWEDQFRDPPRPRGRRGRLDRDGKLDSPASPTAR